MKKPLSKKTLKVEASLWNNIINALKENSSKVCQK